MERRLKGRLGNISFFGFRWKTWQVETVIHRLFHVPFEGFFFWLRLVCLLFLAFIHVRQCEEVWLWLFKRLSELVGQLIHQ
jgi:hypothetical protein